MKKESEIEINGTLLSVACSRTVRIAIEQFALHLMENGCGDDEYGISITQNYMNRINDIRKLMYRDDIE